MTRFSVSPGRAVLAFSALIVGLILGPALLFGGPKSSETTDEAAVIPEDSGQTPLTLPGPATGLPSTGDPARDLNLQADQASEEARSGSSSKSPAAPEADDPGAAQPQAPPPVDTTGWKSFGEMNIADFSVNDALLSGTGQPGSARFACFASHFNYDDPIVAPLQPGAAHLHMFFGNTLADHASTFESLSKTGDGTCSGRELNRTAYWIPALIDTNEQARIPQYSLIYYKSGPMAGQTISPIPDDLKMISGNARATTAAENGPNHKWYCGFPGNYPTYYNESSVIPDCKAGDAITLSLVFPQCWDGVNLDSPNHKDHMAFPVGRDCPATHPVIFPQITYNIYWNNSDMSTAGWYLSSDKHGGLNVPGGTTTHGDWFGAWHPEIMSTLVEGCSNQGHDCKGGTISPNLRLLTSPNTGISDGQDIYNGHRSPQFIGINAI